MRIKTWSLGLSCAALIALIAQPVLAGQADSMPHAPLPEQITAAKSVFISNLGSACFYYNDGSYQPLFPGGESLPYDEFYADIKNWGRYEIASAPKRADLVLQLKLTCPENPGKGDFSGELELSFADPGTSTVLWTIRLPFNLAWLERNRRKDLRVAVDGLVGQLKVLVSGVQPKQASRSDSGS